MIVQGQPSLILAPMHGVTDVSMRTVMTERGGFNLCVSEFLRINHEVPPYRTFYEHVPELYSNCATPSGIPVQVQLLGGNAENLAQSALRASELGATSIDLNFGCPARTVNRHDGGASILRYPHRVYEIVSAVRQALPREIPLSAKLRLGWESKEDIYLNAEMAAQAGASWLTIHARTRAQGYAPPAYWGYIKEVRGRVGIPVVANGDIWSFEDFLRCQEETGSEHFMLGRGALGNPSLVHQIAQHLGIPIPEKYRNYDWTQIPEDWEPLFRRFSEISLPVVKNSHYTACRIKQWLKFATTKHSVPWYGDMTRKESLDEIFAMFELSIK